MSLCKRGDSRIFLCLWTVLIFWDLLSAGSYCVYLNVTKWVSSGAKRSLIKAFLNGKQLVHSLTFGGRGMFIANSNSSKRKYKRKEQNFFSSCQPRNNKVFFFLVLICTVFIIGLLYYNGFVTVFFDQTLGFPGEDMK